MENEIEDYRLQRFQSTLRNLNLRLEIIQTLMTLEMFETQT